MSTPEVPAEEPARRVVDADPPLDIFKSVLTEKYADFTGRARRAEFWWFGVINFAVWLAIVILGAILGVVSEALGNLVGLLGTLYWLGILIPSLAVSVRRLHDTGKTGWWLLIGLIPIVGAIVLLVFYLTDGDKAPNRYGPSPKYVG